MQARAAAALCVGGLRVGTILVTLRNIREVSIVSLFKTYNSYAPTSLSTSRCQLAECRLLLLHGSADLVGTKGAA